MKKQIAKNTKHATVNTGSASHRIWCVVALVGLFMCGVMVGAGHGPVRPMSADECDAVATEMINIIKTDENHAVSERLAELDAMYHNRCPGRVVIFDDAPTSVNANCINVIKTDADKKLSTCSQIEKLLATRLYNENDPNYWVHLDNANVYSTMAERGCSENAERYKEMALREIEIATALQPEQDFTETATESVIETYKKLEMQEQAQAFLDKIERLTNPAIEFILQMEKVINE